MVTMMVLGRMLQDVRFILGSNKRQIPAGVSKALRRWVWICVHSWFLGPETHTVGFQNWHQGLRWKPAAKGLQPALLLTCSNTVGYAFTVT